MDIERGRRLRWSDLLITKRQLDGDLINTRLKTILKRKHPHSDGILPNHISLLTMNQLSPVPLKRKSCGWYIGFNWVQLNFSSKGSRWQLIHCQKRNVVWKYFHHESWTVRWTKVKQAKYTDPGHLASKGKQIGFHNWARFLQMWTSEDSYWTMTCVSHNQVTFVI